MSRFGKKFAAMVLAGAMALTTVTTAFAAGSPVSGNTSDTTIDGTTDDKGGMEVTKASSSSKSLTVAAVTAAGKTFEIDVIKSGAISGKKYNKITFSVKKGTKFQKNVLKGAKAKKSKKIIIKSAGGKLKAKNFNKNAFKGFKGKIVVKKSAMTKKEFNKLKKRLKGLKGKIVRR